jgi:hypothetical protein
MKASAGSAGYRFRHVRLGPGPFHIDTLEDTKTTRYHAGPLSALTVMRICRAVRTALNTGDRFGPGDLAIHAQPGEPSDTRLANVLLRIVYVPLQAAADVARNSPDDDLGPLRFTTVRPSHPAATRSTHTAYLRRVRLEHAHRQLQAATPGDGTTVTAVTARWGYASPSRFAVLYRQTYRQPPSRTLRRSCHG